MILTNRRLRTLYIALTGMEASVLSLYLMLFLHWEPVWQQPPAANWQGQLSLLGLLWISLLGMILSMDLLANSPLKEQGYRLSVIGLVLGSWLLGVRLLAFPDLPPFSLAWLPETGAALVNFHQGMTPPLFLTLLIFFLWLRASGFSGKELNFFGVGVSFRLGMLLTLLGGGILAVRHPALTTGSVWVLALYMGAGLLAVALARSDEKASAAAGSPGSPLPWDRLAQLLVIIGSLVGGALWLAHLYTPAQILATLGLFDWLWQFLARIGNFVMVALFLLLQGIVFGIYWLLQPFLEHLSFLATLADALENFQFVDESLMEEQVAVTPWRYAGLLQMILRVVILLGVLGVLAFLIYVFLSRRRAHGEDEAEESRPAVARLPGNPLADGLARLQRLADLVRQYGLGSQLLDAITVENIYANLSRLARQRGFPRQPAQPPDEYLPQLTLAFPGHRDALTRITDAYMQVHYGDQPVAGDELAALRQDYEQVRQGNQADQSAPAGHALK
jgi:hypothetical protein